MVRETDGGDLSLVLGENICRRSGEVLRELETSLDWDQKLRSVVSLICVLVFLCLRQNT